ncbi:MAG TPA: hypothetical protein VL404_08935 [Candidatus Eisenbacteria bacterium]|jgi:hypothetical protein|nr:hypothetical protein [Candidatus Eisenbacteria bacterium]
MRNTDAALFLAVFLLATAPPAAAVEYTGSQARDPFSDGSEGVDIKQEIMGLALSLEGVVWNSENPQAIISGKIVSVGQKVNKAEVLEIKRDGVKMRYKNQTFVLRSGRKS